MDRRINAPANNRVAQDDEWSGFEYRFLRVDPAQLGRINEMIENAEERRVAPTDRASLGEVAALKECSKHLRIRRPVAQQ